MLSENRKRNITFTHKTTTTITTTKNIWLKQTPSTSMILLIFSLLSGIVAGSNGSNINRHLKAAPPPKASRSLVEKHGYAPLRDVDYGGLHPFELYQTRKLQSGFDPEQHNLQYGNRDAYEKLRIKFITEPLESLRGTSSIADEKIGIIMDTVRQIAVFWIQHDHKPDSLI
jgi:hypothetical protein